MTTNLVKNRLWIWQALLLFVMIGATACAKKKKTASCLDARDEILNQTDAIACNPMTIDRFQERVNGWGEECKSYISKEDSTNVYKKLQYAVKCTEKRLQLEAKSKKCAEDLKQLDAQAAECIGVECDPFVAQLKNILKECSDPSLGSMYKLQAEKKLPGFEERAANGPVLGELKTLTIFCDDQATAAAEGNAKQVFKQLEKTIKKNDTIRQTPNPGSEIERFTQKALASCSYALQTAISAIVQEADVILSSKEIKRSSAKWRRAFKQLRKLRKPLKQMQAEELFPGSTDSLQEVLEKHQ